MAVKARKAELFPKEKKVLSYFLELVSGRGQNSVAVRGQFSVVISTCQAPACNSRGCQTPCKREVSSFYIIYIMVGRSTDILVDSKARRWIRLPQAQPVAGD
jgi:hypothetical protein